MAGLSECPVTVGPRPKLMDKDQVTRFGLVALSTDLTIEADLAVLMPSTAQVHVTRVPYANPTTPENLAAMGPRLAEAAELIAPGAPLAALCFGCTSGSAVIGNDVIARAFATARPDVPSVTPTSALLCATAALGIRRIAVLTPYLPETTRPLIDLFVAEELEVVAAHCLGLADDREMARISPEDIVSGAVAADDPRAEAVFLSCTALPALAHIESIEARIGKPVLTSNQLCAWAMLRAARLGPARPIGRLWSRQEAA